jgi:LysM repeat protein
VDPARRRELQRFAAPVAFLAAATVAVLLIKSGLSGHSARTVSAPVAPTTTRRTGTAATTTRTTATAAARYYTIESGDTLGSVAAKESTTVTELLRLNPGIDPNGLHVGQRIRVG